MRAVLVAVILGLASPLLAQESRLQSEVRRESDDLHGNCASGFAPKQLVDCIVAIATDDPFHLALGSLPPLNGSGLGLAFVEHSTPNENWRISWNADAIVTTSAAWRAGAYVKLIHIPDRPIIVVRPGSGATSDRKPSVPITEYPVFNIYAQTTSLNTVALTAGHDTFSERQTIFGTNVIFPLTSVAGLGALRPALIGAVNGRLLNVQSDTFVVGDVPGFAQFEEGVRLKPSAFEDRLQFNYVADFQQFVAAADSHASFHRWTLDLKNTVPIYRTVSSVGPRDTNGPNECFQSIGGTCPQVSYSRNLEGAIGIRFLATQSTASAGDQVPFYFQPTLGGTDLNGQRLLSGYDDYQFRGPNLIAVQETFEHSIWGPIGAYLLVEQGKVTQAGDGFSSGDFLHSIAVGITLRAGGFPLVNLSFAWGGDGHHVIGAIDPTLLGGSPRPPLF